MPSEYIRTRGVVNKRGRGKARGGVVNRRGRRKVRVVTALVSPVMGRAGCPGREQDCLKPTGAGVGLALAYTIRIHSETGPGRVVESSAGTWEQ